MSHRLWIGMALGSLACAAPAQETPPAGDVAVADSAPQIAVAPVTGTRSAGTLSWEELSVRMVGRETSAGLRIDVTTLEDYMLDVAAPDIRSYLLDLKVRARDQSGISERAAGEMKSFLVGFTGFEKEVHYDPTLLHIRSEASTFYPLHIVPVSRGFERRVVDLYQTVYAVYLFEPSVDLNATLDFRYAELSSGSAWRSLVNRVNRAQARRERDTGR
ncbi:MAG: hypothetical protein ACREMK_00230 [Gemmatimonadota bacterium]